MSRIVATDELYMANKRSIEKACWQAWSRNPIVPLDDYRSYADEVFMDAVKSFNESAGTRFNSWLTTQLLRLKSYGARYLMATDTSGRPESIVMSLDSPASVEGKPCTLGDVGSTAGDDYSRQLAAKDWHGSWESRMESLRPFMSSLGRDARAMVDDILDGNASKKDGDGVPEPEHGRRMYCKLSPRQLYIRLYRRKGWTFERVRAARIEVEDMLRRWSPCRLPEASKVQTQDERF